MPNLVGKVAVVTGATAGIGKSSAIALAQAGAKVVVSGRRQEEGDAVVSQIVAAGGEAIFVKTDVASESDVLNLFTQTVTHFGRVDIAFLNAGVFRFSPIEDQTAEDLAWQIDVNVKGPYYGIKAFVKTVGEEGGVIILNSSGVAVKGVPTGTAYSLTKGAINTLTLAAAVELGPKKIRVNAVSPGPIWTEGTQNMMGDRETFRNAMAASLPIPVVGDPEDIAAAVVYLASPDAKYVTGNILNVDGGWSAK